jgi:beta-mannosidase
VVADGNLRFFRTTMLGRAPGFASGPPVVGPWRPVWLERRRAIAVDGLRLRPRVSADGDEVLAVRADLRALDGALPESVILQVGEHQARLAVGDGHVDGEVTVPAVARWWPHTHGDPVLHEVRLVVGETVVEAGRVGFRALESGRDPVEEGLDLRVNDVPVFARGAVWTPVDPVGLNPDPAALREALELVRDAGMNLLRVPGTGVYETAEFHALCDELGLLVWQDLMFANLDYPAGDPAFVALVEREVRAVLERVGGRAGTVVLCGNSEVEQQAAMLGLDPGLGRTGIWEAPIPQLVAAAGLDAVWVPSAPCGGDLPFRPDRGVANWFGVGGYRLGLDEARRAGVRFASECLAFANVGDDDATALRGVPRDVGAAWDFADVRDHYLRELLGVDPEALGASDPARYLELSRWVTGEVMAEVIGEWRRAGSPCGGGLVLWLRDLEPGSGWGLVDWRGRPKVALAHLRRVLAPVAVWTTDERLGGIAVHVANDGPEPLHARLRVALYRGERRVDEGSAPLELPAHGTASRDVEGILGHFADAAWAYRFGPPGHDAVVATLEGAAGERLGQAFRFPAGRPLDPLAAAELGLEASAHDARLVVRSRRLAYGVRVHAPGWAAADDAFCVEPGGEREILLRPAAGARGPIELSALNLAGRVAAEVR